MVVHAKNKKRKHYLKNIYPNERYDIPKTPHELEYRINNGMEQRIKTFDFFISHSFRDYEVIQKLIDYENEKGKNIFCDWINDADYLKRHLLCEDTLKVLKKRMDQSKALLFVDSDNSRESDWCKYELNYFMTLGKPMYIITLKDIMEDCYSLTPFEDKWYYDTNYKDWILF